MARVEYSMRSTFGVMGVRKATPRNVGQVANLPGRLAIRPTALFARNAIIWLAAGFVAGHAAAADYSGTPEAVRLQGQVSLAEEADLSPREAGILKEVPVVEGTRVDKGQLVLQLEDTKAEAELKIAQAELHSAETKANDDINIKYSIAAAEVAKHELKFNLDANDKVPGSVPKAKIEELGLKVTETSLAIDKAKHDKIVAETEAAIALAKVKAADTMINLLKVFSPIDGVVVAVRRHEGEAVQPSDFGVVHIINRDKLWVRIPLVPGGSYARERFDKQPATVEVTVAGGKKFTVPGKVVFVNPKSSQGNNYEVKVEVQRESRDTPWPLYPGMTAEVIIAPKGP